MKVKSLTYAEYINTRKFTYGKYKNMTIPEIQEAIEKEKKEKEGNETNDTDG